MASLSQAIQQNEANHQAQDMSLRNIRGKVAEQLKDHVLKLVRASTTRIVPDASTEATVWDEPYVNVLTISNFANLPEESVVQILHEVTAELSTASPDYSIMYGGKRLREVHQSSYQGPYTTQISCPCFIIKRTV
jgi:hypothetical protein